MHNIDRSSPQQSSLSTLSPSRRGLQESDGSQRVGGMRAHLTELQAFSRDSRPIADSIFWRIFGDHDKIYQRRGIKAAHVAPWRRVSRGKYGTGDDLLFQSITPSVGGYD